MKKIKVIDLLNKIAEGEQPSHIRIYNRDWYWNNYDGYVTEGSLSTTPDAQIYLFGSYRLDFALDKEVEIIEKKPKKIEEIPYHYNLGYIDRGDLKREVVEELSKNFNYFANKINELTKAVNYLLEKESDK